MVEHRLDCRAVRCPMPIVRMAMSLRDLAIGDDLIVEATDPAFLADANAWSRLSGQPLEQLQDGALKRVRIRKVHA
jgi:tRNA 2-thiouridine synthesizing protein A